MSQSSALFLAIIAFLPALFSCSSLRARNEERKIQSQIVRALNDKTPQYAECARAHRVYELKDSERLRVELRLSLDSRGRLTKFQIEQTDLPTGFVDCLFSVTEEIEFPRNEGAADMEILQPFIFTKQGSTSSEK